MLDKKVVHLLAGKLAKISVNLQATKFLNAGPPGRGPWPHAPPPFSPAPLGFAPHSPPLFLSPFRAPLETVTPVSVSQFGKGIFDDSDVRLPCARGSRRMAHQTRRTWLAHGSSLERMA